jgi:hypothetical protein
MKEICNKKLSNRVMNITIKATPLEYIDQLKPFILSSRIKSTVEAYEDCATELLKKSGIKSTSEGDECDKLETTMEILRDHFTKYTGKGDGNIED